MPVLQIFQQCQAVVAVFCGISVCLRYFWRSEHHLQGAKYLQSFVGLFAAATAILKFSLKSSRASSLSSVAQYNFYILLGLYGSLLCYRLLWHPIRKFPGPRGAAVSSASFLFNGTA